jgi:hypothetical protein
MSAQRSTIRRDVRVFISAVTRELGSVRKLVKKGLEDNDYHAVEQDNFPPDYRVLKDKLRERIASCDAVVHIAGHCYGAEPAQRPADAPRRSYTQLEYDMALELGKPVYVFLTGDPFPTDPHEPEAAELQELQREHRRRLTATGRDYNPTNSLEQLDQKVRSIQLKVESLREELQRVDERVSAAGGRLRRWLAAVAVVGVVAVAASDTWAGGSRPSIGPRRKNARSKSASAPRRPRRARKRKRWCRSSRNSPSGSSSSF